MIVNGPWRNLLKCPCGKYFHTHFDYEGTTFICPGCARPRQRFKTVVAREVETIHYFGRSISCTEEFQGNNNRE